jgi:hypothetical protein
MPVSPAPPLMIPTPAVVSRVRFSSEARASPAGLREALCV